MVHPGWGCCQKIKTPHGDNNSLGDNHPITTPENKTAHIKPTTTVENTVSSGAKNKNANSTKAPNTRTNNSSAAVLCSPTLIPYKQKPKNTAKTSALAAAETPTEPHPRARPTPLTKKTLKIVMLVIQNTPT